jgi:hypothetical protein
MLIIFIILSFASASLLVGRYCYLFLVCVILVDFRLGFIYSLPNLFGIKGFVVVVVLVDHAKSAIRKGCLDSCFS